MLFLTKIYVCWQKKYLPQKMGNWLHNIIVMGVVESYSFLNRRYHCFFRPSLLWTEGRLGRQSLLQ